MPIQNPYTELEDVLTATKATAKSLIVAPAAGVQIAVWQMYISTATAAEFDFNTDEWVFHAPARGGMMGQLGGVTPLFVCDAATALTYTTDVAVTSFIKLWYTLV